MCATGATGSGGGGAGDGEGVKEYKECCARWRAVRKTAVQDAIYEVIHATIGLPSKFYSSQVGEITYFNEPIDLNDLKANLCYQIADAAGPEPSGVSHLSQMSESFPLNCRAIAKHNFEPAPGESVESDVRMHGSHGAGGAQTLAA
ncbi:g3586 [Coccomyxa viridis]|uniref:G3586 protein n=1 Tax=Coccomyxa viridis TaxID=1274662 RepID=A0ABP1FN66_9CHLO